MYEILQKIHNITLQLIHVLDHNDFEEFEHLLHVRKEAIMEVECFKEKNPTIQYSQLEIQLLKEIYTLNGQLTKKSEDIKTNIQISINKLNSKKQLFKYKPFFQQTNGVFVDKILGEK